jgi:Cytochrome P460
MRCTYSKALIALHVEGDLSGDAAAGALRHVAACDACRRFADELRATQSLLKSRRLETVSTAECARMRRDVMSIIQSGQTGMGWALRIERAFVLGCRQHAYGLAALALLVVASVPVLTQLRSNVQASSSGAVFEGSSTLVRPENYRAWMSLGGGSATQQRPGGDDQSSAPPLAGRRVYINEAGYREYVKTGTFPEGTLLVWEGAGSETETGRHPHGSSPVLLASVKDSTRFDGGWGFFDFGGSGGATVTSAQALPESSACRMCHRLEAETDHVFTQFYPVLRAARGLAGHSVPSLSAWLTET